MKAGGGVAAEGQRPPGVTKSEGRGCCQMLREQGGRRVKALVGCEETGRDLVLLGFCFIKLPGFYRSVWHD